MTYFCVYEFAKGINAVGIASSDEFFKMKNKELGKNQVLLECTVEFYNYYLTHEFGYPDQEFRISDNGILTFI